MGRKHNRRNQVVRPINDRVLEGQFHEAPFRKQPRRKGPQDYSRYGSKELRRAYLTTSLGRQLSAESIENLKDVIKIPHTEWLQVIGAVYLYGNELAKSIGYGANLPGLDRHDPDQVVAGTLAAADLPNVIRNQMETKVRTNPTSTEVRKWGSKACQLAINVRDTPYYPPNMVEKSVSTAQMAGEKATLRQAFEFEGVLPSKPPDLVRHRIDLLWGYSKWLTVTPDQTAEISEALSGVELVLQEVGVLHTGFPPQ